MSARSIAGSALFLVATLPSVLGQQSADPVAGERLAAANCTKCHGAHGAAPAFAKIAAMPSTTQTSLGVFLGGPFDERNLVVEPPGFRRLQPRRAENALGRLAEPALREDRNAAWQPHVVGAREIEDVIADLEKEAENLGPAGDRHRAVP